MMTHKIAIIALIAGIVLGAAATEGFNLYRQSHASRIFQERLRCKAVADAYVKANSSDLKEDPFAKSWVTVTLDRADYSPSRNTCVAELETTNWDPRIILENSSVQDLLSGETLFSTKYTEHMGSVKEVYTDPAFDYVIKNASEPVREEQFYLYYLAHSDAKGNPKPDSKHPPSSSNPDPPSMSPASMPKALNNKPKPQ